MHIGLIGGIGVSATQVYYKRLTDACVARGTPDIDITIVHADARTLIRHNLADDRDAQAEIFARLIDRLKAAGADCAAITSLGGHFCFAETQDRASLPLVSAVTPLDAYFAKNGLKIIGLLGTEVVMRTKLYGQLTQTQAVVPENIVQVGKAYLDMAVAGHASETQSTFMLDEGTSLIEQGAQAVVLAGTDLGLVFDEFDPGYRVIDALDVHVDLLADLATDMRDLPAA